MGKTKYGENTTIEWTDKKRYLGMPISFTRYSLVSKTDSWVKLFVKTGLLFTSVNEVSLFRIFDIQITQSLGQKMFGVGTITLFAKDETTPQVYIANVKNPYDVRNMLAQRIEEERARKNVKVGEFYA